MQSDNRCTQPTGKHTRIYLLFAGILLFCPCTSRCRAEDTNRWYPFTPQNRIEPGEIGLQDWIDAPVFALAPYQKDGCLVSSTGELRWHEGLSKLDGYITIDGTRDKTPYYIVQY